MKRLIKICLISFFILTSTFFSFTNKVEASSLNLNFFTIFSKTADEISQRVSDMITYLANQKKYIFNDFTDPNTYVSWTIPEDFEKTISTLIIPNTATTTKVITGKPVAVNSQSVPDVKLTIVKPPVTTTNQVTTPVPGLILNPAPLTPSVPVVVVPKAIPGADSNILKYTNEERIDKGLKALTNNSLLDTIARLRVDDLFENQYFEHESPKGQSAPVIAKNQGYSYLLIGENLAMGNFGGDRGIVDAWMDSHGHRANILNSKYKELGASQRVDIFKGNKVTIAVQIFGDPANVCSKPSSTTKNLITTSTASITQLQLQAKDMYDNITVLKNTPGIDQSYYNQKIQEYNYFAKSINEAVVNLKIMVEQYNSQVNQYNKCITS